MSKTLSQKLSFRLFLLGLLLIALGILANTILDAVLFGNGNIQEHLFSPSYHALAIRVLTSLFILTATYLGMHFLADAAMKENTLQQNNADLRLARQDLEEFQDRMLQQLRNTASEVATAIELLDAQQGQGGDEKGDFFINGVRTASNRLNRQIEISRALTGFSHGEPRRERVNIDVLAVDIAEELKTQYPERNLSFTIQPWLNDWCDKKMLRLVMHNLFRSAMDFIPPTRQGQIEFGMFNRNNQKIFFVRDNGIGFNEAQAKSLFDSFRNGYQESNLPKDTIRLASARRIINRHGGEIWAEGIPDVSGTIFFTLDNS